MNKLQPQRNPDTLNSLPSFVLWPISHPSASGKPTCCPHPGAGRAERVRGPVGTPSASAPLQFKVAVPRSRSEKIRAEPCGICGWCEGPLCLVGAGQGVGILLCQPWASLRIFRAQGVQGTGCRAIHPLHPGEETVGNSPIPGSPRALRVTVAFWGFPKVQDFLRR